MSALLSGELLNGRYTLRSQLGAGAFAEVWRAGDGTLGDDVAVKFLRPELTAVPGVVERFNAEVGTLLRLRSKYLVTVRDRGVYAGRHFMVMDLVDGETLEAWLARERRLSAYAARELIRQVCEGVQEAHEAGVVHRDLKPSNILIERSRERFVAKVTDFGIAQVNGPKTTRVGYKVGTEAYMSPEQGRGKSREVVPASDVFSLALLLVEMLGGTVVPTSDDASEAWWNLAIDGAIPARLAQVAAARADIPEGVWAAIRSALSVRIAERAQDAALFSRSLLSNWPESSAPSSNASRPPAKVVETVAPLPSMESPVRPVAPKPVSTEPPPSPAREGSARSAHVGSVVSVPSMDVPSGRGDDRADRPAAAAGAPASGKPSASGEGGRGSGRSNPPSGPPPARAAADVGSVTTPRSAFDAQPAKASGAPPSASPTASGFRGMPASAFDGEGGVQSWELPPLRRNGDLLVVRRGAQLPYQCLVCGANDKVSSKSMELSSVTSGLFIAGVVSGIASLLHVVGGLLSVLAIAVFVGMKSKTATLLAPVCARHTTNILAWRAVSLIALLASIGLGIAAIVALLSDANEWGYGRLFAIPGSILAVLGFSIRQQRGSAVWLAEATPRDLKIGGVDEAVLSRFPETMS